MDYRRPGALGAGYLFALAVFAAAFQPAVAATFTSVASMPPRAGAVGQLSYGNNPAGGLVLGTDGNFYFSTVYGGRVGDKPCLACQPEGNFGAIMRMTAAGTLTPLYGFGFTNAWPQAGLTRGRDGRLYGTTGRYSLTPEKAGSVFRISESGSFSELHAFSDSALSADPAGGPEGDLLLAKDGKLYGVTSGGGTLGFGSVFSVATTGLVETVAEFSSINGSAPLGGLLQDGNGDFYGTTSAGGLYGAGTVYRLKMVTVAGKTQSVISAIYHFKGSDGSAPAGVLVLGTDRVLRGTTASGGQYGKGTVFRLTLDGKLTVQHSFRGSDGEAPEAGLRRGLDGRYYGTTSAGGSAGLGTVYSVGSQNGFTSLHSFAGADGSHPVGSLLRTADGAFYGATMTGGISDFGSIYRIAP